MISTPQFNAVTLVSFNNTIPPFDNAEVRRAIAAALPYKDMFKAALFGRGTPLFDGNWPDGRPPSANFPIPQPVHLDWRSQKAPRGGGLPTASRPRSASASASRRRPSRCRALIRESLAKIGIKVEIRKLPDAQMSTLISDKKVPFFIDGIVAWLPSTDYFFRNFYTGNQRWELFLDLEPRHRADRQYRALRARQGEVRRGSPRTERDPLRRNATDSDLATEPGRGDAALDQGLRLPVPPPGRLPRSEPGIGKWP